jgi:hypothetical protein
MGKCSTIRPDSEIYKSLYNDFSNYQRTGRKPFGRGIGGREHWMSSALYKTVTHGVFRSHAQKIAQKVCQDLKLADYADDPPDQAELAKKIRSPTSSDHGNATSDVQDGNGNAKNDVLDSSDEDDENYTTSINESVSEDGLDGFDEIEMGEILNSRQPFLTEYPTRDKVLVIFPLDGDVLDSDGNQFEFADNNQAIQRLGKVPKERESCVALIGDGKEQPTKMGYESADLMVVDAEIKKRLQSNEYKRDENGNIWEIRATLELPFKCDPQLRDRSGQVMRTFRMQSNGRGFRWVYFWLLACKPPKPKPAKRIQGTLVTVMSKEDSSIYTEKTYESNKKKSRK